ncbi:hypothetical protein BHE74_00038990 [Ensete ventricosum]|nr:hypothetical protein BHE74_00038990 [Ensete ventricosum]
MDMEMAAAIEGLAAANREEDDSGSRGVDCSICRWQQHYKGQLQQMMTLMVMTTEGSTAADKDGDGNDSKGVGCALTVSDNVGTEDDTAGSARRGRMATRKREGRRVVAATVVATGEGPEEDGSCSNQRRW